MSDTRYAIQSLGRDVETHDGCVSVDVGSDYDPASRHAVLLGLTDTTDAVCIRLTPSEAARVAAMLLFYAEEARNRPTRTTEQLEF